MVTNLVLLFFTSLFISLLITGKSPTVARWIGAVDHPDTRKAHQHAIPRLGGLGIAVALFASLLLFVPMSVLLQAFLLGAVVIAATGMLDDALQISPIAKFAGQIVAVLLFVLIADVHLTHFGDLLAVGDLYTGSLALPITVVCMVGVINSLNLSDGLDGLAGGLSAIATAFLGVFAFSSQNWTTLAITVSLFGAILGFLRYNSYPAKLFMGDTGSLLLGYSLAAITLLLVQPASTGQLLVSVTPISVALVLLLPIFDTILVMLRRLWLGFSPFSPDKTHLHHRLMELGFPHAAVVPILYTIMVIMGTMAIILQGMPEWLQLLLGLVVIITIYAFVVACQHTNVTWRPSFVDYSDYSFHETKIYQSITTTIGKSVPWLLGFIATVLVFPILFVSEVSNSISYYAMAVAVVFVLLFPWKARHGYYAIVHGLLYLACVSIIFSLNMSQQAVPWLSLYMQIASGIVLLWVLLKLIFKRNNEVFLTSGFEFLLIFISWFIPMIVLPQIHAPETLTHLITLVCIETIPFFIAFKIIIREQPRRNSIIALSMVFALVLLGCKGLFAA